MILNGIYMVHHHVCYEEIHGYDLVILIPSSEHKLLHNRLRKEGKCNIPANELAKISRNSKHGIESSIKSQKKYNKNLDSIDFYERLESQMGLHERIVYNYKTGNISITISFKNDSGLRLPIINLI